MAAALGAGRRRGFSHSQAGGGGASEKMRTHMMFSAVAEHQQKRKIRRTHNKLHQTHKKDEMVQTGPTTLDPNQWTGNQRVVHFGPLAQRDPFFYYYPKGWDVLYPAHFGFFPYRTTKFRGSSLTICVTAFGFFAAIAGLAMVYIGFCHLYTTPFWSETFPLDYTPPIQVAGPILLVFGLALTLIGLCRWCWSLNLLSERLQHTQPHQGPPKRQVHTYRMPEYHSRLGFEKSPYQPLPPPAFPVVVNAHTEPCLFSPEAEAKLYPPVMPSANSMLSLQRSYVGSPYNTLSGGTTRYSGSGGTSIGNAHALAAQVLELEVGAAVATRKISESSGESKSAVIAPVGGGRRGTRLASLGRISNSSSSKGATRHSNGRQQPVMIV